MLLTYVIFGCCEDHTKCISMYVWALFLKFKIIEYYSNLKGFQNSKKTILKFQ